MQKSKLAYMYDEQGYYIGSCLVNQNLKEEWVLPKNTTLENPILKDGYWTKFNYKKWILEKKPNSCAECIEKQLTCISNGQGQHNYEVKAILESLVAADSEHYKIVVSSDFVEQIEEIPAPTPEEQQQKEDEAKEKALEAAINDLIHEMSKADLMGDEEWKAELREEYEALIQQNEGE